MKNAKEEFSFLSEKAVPCSNQRTHAFFMLHGSAFLHKLGISSGPSHRANVMIWGQWTLPAPHEGASLKHRKGVRGLGMIPGNIICFALRTAFLTVSEHMQERRGGRSSYLSHFKKRK